MVTGKTDETPYTDTQYLKLVEITQSCSEPIHGCVLRELWSPVISLLQEKLIHGLRLIGLGIGRFYQTSAN